MPQPPRIAALCILPLLLAGTLPTRAGSVRASDATAAGVLEVGSVAPTRGRLVPTPTGDALIEELTVASGLTARLLALPIEGTIWLRDWPVAPDERRDIDLRRIDVYAPDAKIWEVTGSGLREHPRSSLAFFVGVATDEAETRVRVTVDPRSGTLAAASWSSRGTFELRAVAGGSTSTGEASHHLVPIRSGRGVAAAEGGYEPSWSCGDAELPAFLRRPSLGDELAPPVANLASLHTASIAVDTDNELMNLKFGNSAAPAIDYIANLIAAMNVTYERDVNVRLVQGTTYLRPSTTADPYSGGTGSADGTKLDQFSNHWAANYPTTTLPRALAMLLSGKQASNFSASGIAWLSGLCNNGTGYSVSQVFKYAQDTSADDASLVGHELGHNFGSPHTHCYTPPVDTCFSGESVSCYNGATSCPAPQTINGVTNVRGTLMSYCHLLGGCNASEVFHPTTLSTYINPHATANIGTCIFPATTPGPTVTVVNPAQGGDGTPVTITGTNFENGAVVRFDTALATGVIVVNATTITANAPAHAVGPVPVTVINPGARDGSKVNAFEYLPPPTVTGVTPSSGSTAGGTAVTITGTGFQSGASVDFALDAAASVAFVSSTTLTAVTPAHATGNVAVTVTNPDAQSGAKNPGFFYVPPPTAVDFYTLTPCRVFDTRSPLAPIAGGAQLVFNVAGTCGVPASADAVSANVTVIEPASFGNVAIYPGNAFPLGTSTVNFTAASTRANNAILTLATDGAGTIGVRNSSSGAIHLVLDVNGYFE